MSSIFENRKLFGECYVSRFPNGLEIPWKQLNLKDFIKYDLELRSGRLPAATIEDEIFQLCVLDENIKLNIDFSRAGVVTTVVHQIMEASGPTGPEQIRTDLHYARERSNNFLADSVAVILQVFSGYTAESVFSLPYEEFLQLLAMAERRLMAMGIIDQPLEPVIQGSEAPSEIEFRNLNPEPAPPPRPEPRRREKNKDFVAEGAAGEMIHIPEGMTPQDRAVYAHLHAPKWKQDAIEGLDLIYPELMEKMKKGEKITPETIKQSRGRSPQEVKKKYEKYQKDILGGKIEHRPSRPSVAFDTQEGARPKAKRPGK